MKTTGIHIEEGQMVVEDYWRDRIRDEYEQPCFYQDCGC